MYLLFILLHIFAFGNIAVVTKVIDILTLSSWYGSAAYLPVNRDAVQSVLDEFRSTRKGKYV